jgi:thioredoxin reductase (NADPH)
VGQLSGQTALVDAYAVTNVESLLIPSKNLRTLLHALILRRIALIETGAGGPVLIGTASSPDMVRLQGFLARNDYPKIQKRLIWRAHLEWRALTIQTALLTSR